MEVLEEGEEGEEGEATTAAKGRAGGGGGGGKAAVGATAGGKAAGGGKATTEGKAAAGGNAVHKAAHKAARAMIASTAEAAGVSELKPEPSETQHHPAKRRRANEQDDNPSDDVDGDGDGDVGGPSSLMVGLLREAAEPEPELLHAEDEARVRRPSFEAMEAAGNKKATKKELKAQSQKKWNEKRVARLHAEKEEARERRSSVVMGKQSEQARTAQPKHGKQTVKQPKPEPSGRASRKNTSKATETKKTKVEDDDAKEVQPRTAWPNGRPPRVTVVGAGPAGLCAARLLHHYGVETTVLEGRDRIGGRILSETLPARPEHNLPASTVDLGASFVHG